MADQPMKELLRKHISEMAVANGEESPLWDTTTQEGDIESGRDETKVLIPEPTPEVTPEVKAGSDAKDESSDETAVERKEFTDDDLLNTFVEVNVYGEKKKVPLKEIRDSYQIQEAAQKKLDESKELNKKYKELVDKYEQALKEANKPQQKPVEEGEYQDPLTRELNTLKKELEQVKGYTESDRVSRLQAKEDATISQMVGDKPPSEWQPKILKVIESNPHFTPVVAELLQGSPTSEEQLQKRIALFDALWTKAQSLELQTEMPKVVQEIQKKAKEEGKKEVKKDLKQKLVNVEGGSSEVSSQPDKRTLMKRAQARGDDGWAEYFKRKNRGG